MTDTERIQRRAGDIPASCRALYLRAVAGKASPRQAIKAKCQECMGWEEVAKNVRNCPSPTCPLYPFRPFKPSEGSDPEAPERSGGVETPQSTAEGADSPGSSGGRILKSSRRTSHAGDPPSSPDAPLTQTGTDAQTPNSIH